MKYHAHLNTAIEILQSYHGTVPFAHFIKNFFRQHKKFGSTDRKNISHLCYCYFRLGHALKGQPWEEKMLAAIFLCSSAAHPLLEQLRPDWNLHAASTLEEKLARLGPALDVTKIFPWQKELSPGVDPDHFCKSFLWQPDLFLRVRPGKKFVVINKLKAAAIAFEQHGEACLAVENATQVDKIIELDREAVIQDLSSQQTARFLEPCAEAEKARAVWDCCAGSGGKSIMAHDLLQPIDLTVSDIRESVLVNLTKRFAKAGIPAYRAFRADLSDGRFQPGNTRYDLIIADLPCSGSGTWGRTPENLHFFDSGKIHRYQALQKQILANVIPALKKNGRLIYITCSVFGAENEAMAHYIAEQFHLKLEKMEILKGYTRKSDTMFGASFLGA